MKGTLTGIFICLLTIASFGQAKTLKFTGKVTDASNNAPLVSANITVEGTSIGTKTDTDGNFFITLEEGKKYIWNNTVWAAVYAVLFALTVLSSIPWF